MLIGELMAHLVVKDINLGIDLSCITIPWIKDHIAPLFNITKDLQKK